MPSAAVRFSSRAAARLPFPPCSLPHSKLSGAVPLHPLASLVPRPLTAAITTEAINGRPLKRRAPSSPRRPSPPLARPIKLEPKPPSPLLSTLLAPRSLSAAARALHGAAAVDPPLRRFPDDYNRRQSFAWW